MSCEDSNWVVTYKIGVTSGDVNKRLSQLQTGNPYKLSVVYVFESKYSNKVESYLHKRFGTFNVRNEWFELSDSQVNSFIHECQVAHNMFDVLNNRNTYYNRDLLYIPDLF